MATQNALFRAQRSDPPRPNPAQRGRAAGPGCRAARDTPRSRPSAGGVASVATRRTPHRRLGRMSELRRRGLESTAGYPVGILPPSGTPPSQGPSPGATAATPASVGLEGERLPVRNQQLLPQHGSVGILQPSAGQRGCVRANKQGKAASKRVCVCTRARVQTSRAGLPCCRWLRRGFGRP